MTAKNRILHLVMPWLVIVSILLIWQLTVTILDTPSFILPSPVAIYKAFLEHRNLIMSHASLTMMNTAAGFTLGVLVGLTLGIIIGTSPLMYSGLYPVLIGFNSVPKVALVPIIVLWFGIGQPTAIATAFVLCFFPIAVNVSAGLATVEPEVEDVLRSLGASKMDILKKIGLPRAMPYFFASLKISITLAFVGTVIAETIASNDGIGYLMMQASSQFRVPLMFAGVAVIAALGILTYVIFALIEKRMTGWANRGQR